MQVHIDGAAPAEADLAHLALVNYGHFTAMQVRRGAVRGLDLHLQRLDEAHREMFGSTPDLDRVRELLRRAIAGHPDCYLRVTLFETEPGVPRVLTALRPPVGASDRAQSLTAVRYTRPVPHLKHVGTFAQIHHGLAAERAGFDDALLVTEQGHVAETTMANIGFLRGADVVWPRAPSLRGITWQLLDSRLPAHGGEVQTEVVPLTAVGQFEAAFLASSLGVAAVARIDAQQFATDHPGLAELAGSYEQVPWDLL